MNRTWIMSDTHYGHINICYGTSRWKDKEVSCHRFNTVEEMNDAIVKSINDVVDQTDIIYFLGDWSMSGVENIYKFFSRLICKNIFFVPGNHDEHIIKNHLSLGIAPEDMFHILPELYTLYYRGYKFILSHYPIEQWKDMGKGAIHLHGHTHHVLDKSVDNTKYKRMDVGWKPTGPWLLDDIIEIMDKREVKQHCEND